MFSFTRKTDYALVALASLAEDANVSGAPSRLSARQIAARKAVPLSILMNILKDLVSSGLVTSTRGARGGYSLARPASGITVNEVISATDGRVNVLPCCGTSEDDACQECRIVVTCPITFSVRQLNGRINDFLSEVTLEDLMSASTNAIAPISTAGFKLEKRTLSSPLSRGDR